jgi:exodeoxyribonuclease V beta subunit
VAQAEDERLQEDLRLLYVALTRARHALWLGVGFPVAGKGKAPVLHLSALGQLLGHGEVLAPDHLMEHLATALAGTAGVQIINAAELPPDTASLGATRLLPLGDAPPLQPARPYRGGFARDWGIASFSGLVRELPGPQPAEATRHLLADAALHEELMAEAAELAVEGGGAGSGPEAGSARHLAVSGEAPPSAAELAPWHSFPRGALAGNFLHEQLEWLADKDFALADDPGLQQALLRRCERRGWGHRAEAVRDWLLALVATPLPGPDRPLAGLGTLLPEMEFWFACEASVGARDIDALCCRHILPGVERPALPERQLRGMLMGFADLVFESGGRYWVLDYKSNTLGEDDAAYGPAALAGAMAAHRYDVQAALYLLALHRLLRQRLGLAYDPARQLGGAVYLFMRGLRSPTAGCCVVHPEPALLDGLDALLAGRAGNAHAAGADVAP